MIDDIHMLNSVKGEVLDSYLEAGWYRMGKLVFTTHAIDLQGDGKYARVFWLRYIVENVRFDKTNLQIANKNSQFKVTWRQFSITPELEDLHRRYVASLDFNTSGNLYDLLNDVENKVFDSYLIEVRDNAKLIATGMLDKGGESIEGIINIYDPEYKKYSLGKYLIQLKYMFCRHHGIKYYYPGYYSIDIPVFDYKLFLDKNATQVFLPNNYLWVPYKSFQKMLERE